MRIKTIVREKQDEFDVVVNDFLALATSQGCVIDFIQVTHLEKEYKATIIYMPYTSEGERAPEFLEVAEKDLPGRGQVEQGPTEQGFSDIDKYDKY